MAQLYAASDIAKILFTIYYICGARGSKVSAGVRPVNGHPIKCRETPPCYAGSYSQVQMCTSLWYAMGNTKERRGESG